MAGEFAFRIFLLHLYMAFCAFIRRRHNRMLPRKRMAVYARKFCENDAVHIFILMTFYARVVIMRNIMKF